VIASVTWVAVKTAGGRDRQAKISVHSSTNTMITTTIRLVWDNFAHNRSHGRNATSSFVNIAEALVLDHSATERAHHIMTNGDKLPHFVESFTTVRNIGGSRMAECPTLVIGALDTSDDNTFAVLKSVLVQCSGTSDEFNKPNFGMWFTGFAGTHQRFRRVPVQLFLSWQR